MLSPRAGRGQPACSLVNIVGEGVSCVGTLTKEHHGVLVIRRNAYCQLKCMRGDKKGFLKIAFKQFVSESKEKIMLGPMYLTQTETSVLAASNAL